MIRYNITLQDLHAQIATCKHDWLTRATDATTQFRDAGEYSKTPGDFWGEIKTVYIALQRNKCAFCERYLEWAGDFHVEHFRPKGRIDAWPPPKARQYPFPTGTSSVECYYLLAYHPLNYTAACGKCNVNLKRSFFPVEGTRNLTEADPANIHEELPLLIYPISEIDVDPEDLIHFAGIIPKPIDNNAAHHDNHRARVTIDFFKLERRDFLRTERARIIQGLYFALKYEHRAEFQRDAQQIIEGKTDIGSPHCNCARSFVHLYRDDPELAEQYAEEAAAILKRRSS